MKKDILPEGFKDPMLMKINELESWIGEFEATCQRQRATFLKGVLFARVSILAAGGVA